VPWIALAAFLFFSPAYSHEIQSVTQHINIRKQNESGLQQDVLARINLNRKFDVGAQATYFERFDLYENRVGAMVAYRPNDRWSFEARYLQGMGNDILPEKEIILSAYRATTMAITPYIFYRDSRYSITHLQSANVGLEIEKIPGLIFIPSLMLGQATFKSPGETKEVHSYGLRAIYYQEKRYGVAVYAYRGKEASQGIIGRSSLLVDTLTGGAALSWYFAQNFKSEISFDHTDFEQLGTEFHTTTLILTWMF
jgi:hypothetical protein